MEQGNTHKTICNMLSAKIMDLGSQRGKTQKTRGIQGRLPRGSLVPENEGDASRRGRGVLIGKHLMTVQCSLWASAFCDSARLGPEAHLGSKTDSEGR